MKSIQIFFILLMTLVINYADAQTAVRVLDADYISNVYSFSNFVKNPNAKNGALNVTATGTASASQSKTTPLVEATEFVVSLNSGSSLTWSMRQFDAALKNQVCEARYTYRGFTSGTTTAQFLLGSTIIASKTLTSTADARTELFTFSCGDLTQTPSFRLAQTSANTSGTNEIGGIYVGKILEEASVPRVYGVARSTAGVTNQYNGAAEETGFVATVQATVAYTTSYFGVAAAPTGTNQVGFSVANLPIGDFMISVSGALYGLTGSSYTGEFTRCGYRIFETTTSTTVTQLDALTVYLSTGFHNIFTAPKFMQGAFTNSSVATRNFVLQMNKTDDNSSGNVGYCRIDAKFSSATDLVFTLQPLYR